MEELLELAPYQIVVGERQRALDPKAVEALRLSIKAIGLKTPISVRLIDEEHGYALVSGAHRLQACVDLGMQSIPAREETGTELDAKLWEIAENLHRVDLTVLERAEHIAEWLRLTAERNEVLRQVAVKPTPQKGVGQGIGGGRPPTGTKAIAREIGVEDTDARRANKIDALDDTAKTIARDLGLDDNQSALLAAAKAPTAIEQANVLRDIAAKKATPKPPPPPKLQKSFDVSISPAVEQLQSLIQALPIEELRAFTAWFDDFINKRDI